VSAEEESWVARRDSEAGDRRSAGSHTRQAGGVGSIADMLMKNPQIIVAAPGAAESD
jgi:hypothetical protein